MRIVFATDWFPPRRGGIETQLGEMATRLAARGHAVRVLTTTPGAKDGDGFQATTLDATRFPIGGFALSPSLIPRLRTELRQGCDVVHCHVSVVSPFAYAAASVARSMNLPVVVTFHSILRHKRLLLRIADAVLGLSASGIHWTAVSKLVASQVISAIPHARVDVLPNGVDAGFWGDGATAARSSGRVTFASAMRLHRKKRPLALVRAFASAARAAAQPTRLVIVGDGPMEHAVRAEGERTLLPAGCSIEVLGWRAPRELRDLYSGVDAFVMPSRRESFGLSALEALAAGLPVIAMEESGSTEFLRHDHNALLCRDDAAMARAMTRIIAEPNLRLRLAHGREVAERYDWNVVVPRYEASYLAAIARMDALREAVVASA